MNEKKIKSNIKDAWLQLAFAIGEGVLADHASHQREKNIFGRTVHQSSVNDLAFALGLASTGLRVTSFLEENQLYKNLTVLKQVGRQHIPIVILTAKKTKGLSFLSESNSFLLEPKNIQEAIDFLPIAHRISELALIPGIVRYSGDQELKEDIMIIPGPSELINYLGDTDERIASPSPSQQILFGKTRRRILNWFNPDMPVLSNAAKDERGLAFETAANDVFFNAHLEAFVAQAFEEFAQQTGRNYEPDYILYASKPDELQDVPFAVKDSRFPKHEVLLQAISRDYPKLKDKSIVSQSNNKLSLPNAIPLSIRKHKDQGPAYSRLSRFYDDTALFYEAENSELVADPFQATPVMPPATADFGFNVQSRKVVPVFEPLNCTGCGNCYVQCPHSALPPLALNIESIIKSGIQMAQSKGQIIAQMMPLQKGWVKASCNEINDRKSEISHLKDFLPQAFYTLVQQMKLEGEKLETVSQEMTSIVEAIGDFPIAVTNKFFTERNNIENGSGELFSLAVDLNACTGCGLCAEVCDERAIEMAAQTNEIEENLNHHFSVWEQLPDTSGNTISRLVDDPDYSSFAAVLLSRNFYLTMTGGSKNEETASLKTMLHLVLATTEFTVQPKYQRLQKAISENIDSLSSSIKKDLGDAMPSANYNGLSVALEKASTEKISIDKLLSSWNGKEHLKSIDKSSLQRKIDLVKSLTDLSTAIASGVSGCGRSRYGLVLDESLASLAVYPWNNFTSPVILTGGSSSETAHAIVLGQLRHLLDNLKLLRRATLESQNKYQPSVHDAEIANLSWEDLTDEEKGGIPPVLVIASRSMLRNSGTSPLLELLNTSLPVKVVIFDDCLPPLERSAAFISESNSSLIPALATGKTIILKSSLAAPEHLFSGLRSGLDTSGPALFWLFAARESSHISSNKEPAKRHIMAWNTRAYTHFDFNPLREGALLSSKLNIESNPQSDAAYVQVLNTQITGSKLLELETLNLKLGTYYLTWADWAYTIKDWKTHFSVHQEQKGTAIPVSDFIKLDQNLRSGKSPVVIRVNDAGELVRYTVSTEIIEATEASQNSWNMLREYAGNLTEYPERLYKSVEKTLSEKFETEKTQLVSDFESKISHFEEEHLEKIRLRLREKLLAMSQNGED